MEELKAEAEYLFEASWEVCNKVGGINTVLKSKAILMKKYYKNYVLIGPYFKNNAELELASADIPQEYRKAVDEMKSMGIYCTFGTWLIKGEPNIILIDFQSLVQKKNEIKAHLWDHFKIDSLFSREEFEEPMLWAYATGMLLEKIGKSLPDNKVIAHFHEWLAGFGILYLKHAGSKIRTVFTTHATILGRSIAEGGEDLYSMIETINPEHMAKLKGVMDKYTAEKAAAQQADIFTTVSEITAIEAEKILGRKPEVLVLNGLDVDKFPTIEETSIKHVENLSLIKEYITYHFFPYYTFDLDHTLVYFMLSRYEFKNKGIDVLIKALGKLNEKLQQENSEKTIVMFFWIPTRTYGLKTELLENKNVYRHIKQYIDLKAKDILNTKVDGFLEFFGGIILRVNFAI